MIMTKLITTCFRKYTWKLISFCFLSLTITVLGIYIPILSAEIIDGVVTSITIEDLFKKSTLLLLVEMSKLLFAFIFNQLQIELQSKICFQLNRELIQHIQKVPFNKLQHFDFGYLSQRINVDSNEITNFAIEIISAGFSNFISLIIVIFIIYKINPFLLILLGGLSGIYFIIYIFFKEKIHIISKSLKEKQAQFFSVQLEQLNNIYFIKRHALYEAYKQKLNAGFENYFHNYKQAQKLFFFYSSLDTIITIIATVGIYCFGGIWVLNGNMSIGKFSIIISYFQRIVKIIKSFSGYGTHYQTFIVSYQRIMEIFHISKEPIGTEKIQHINKIVCKHLSFPKSNDPIINNFSYTFSEGKVYGIIGKNGSGKSTFIDLIIGLHPNEYNGEIIINNSNINNLDMEQLRHTKISIMEQKPVIFKENITSNIYITNKHQKHTLQEFLNIAKFKKELCFITNSKITETVNCTEMSGGEQQKISILRLLSKQANLYIMDEPTSSIDKKSLETFQLFIEKLKQKNCIIMLITHDESLISHCDEIINLSAN